MQNLSTFLFLALAGAAFYFLIIRPGKQRQKAQAELLTSIAPGTEIMTTAGVFGRVVTVSEDVLGLEIAPGVVMRILPAAVARVVVSPGDESPVD
ncbi:MAG: preprotein translocase subunit YajC [Actinomycetota bacterium]|nr:preprotein translocase subunit YajC [Actinomycetota bacterium]